MNKISFVRCCIFLIFCLSASVSMAQNRDSYSFDVVSGSVSVTPAYCQPEKCETTTAALSGVFVGFLPGGGSQLYFTSSFVVTKPNLDFQLPVDPNEDSGGVVRNAYFSFDGESLKVEGSIDSRAFDGPLIEYNFIAAVGSGASDDLGYFTARPDYRKCISPLCGGYFVKSVNNRTTLCADGSRQKECYVADIEFPSELQPGVAGFNSTTPLFLVGEIAQKPYVGFGSMGVFRAKSVNYSVTGETAKGYFYGTENNGIVCITSPCFSYDQELLNKNSQTTISRINFEKSGASQDDISEAYRLLGNGETLYASGFDQKYKGFAGTGVEFVVTQFYLPKEF